MVLEESQAHRLKDKSLLLGRRILDRTIQGGKNKAIALTTQVSIPQRSTPEPEIIRRQTISELPTNIHELTTPLPLSTASPLSIQPDAIIAQPPSCLDSASQGLLCIHKTTIQSEARSNGISGAHVPTVPCFDKGTNTDIAAGSDYLVPYALAHTPAPTGHVSWQVEQFLSAFGVNSGAHTDISALVFAFDWAKTELQKRGEEASRWKARYKEKLRAMASVATAGDGATTSPSQDASIAGIPDPNTPREGYGASQQSAPTIIDAAPLPAFINAGDQLKEAWDRNEKLVTAVQNAQRLLKLSQEENARAQGQNDILAQMKTELARLSNVELENTQLQTKYDEAKDKWNESYSKMITTSNQLQKTQHDLALSQASDAASIYKIVELNAKVDFLNTTGYEAECTISSLEWDIHEVDSRYRAARTLVESKDTEVSALNDMVTKAFAEGSQLKEDLGNLKLDYDSKLAINNRFKADVAMAMDTMGGVIQQLGLGEETNNTMVRMVTEHALVPGINDKWNTLFAKTRQLRVIWQALQQHDTTATESLLDRLNVKIGDEWPNYIPDDLVDVIARVGPSAYELSFPLTKLRGLDQAARGIPARSRMVVVWVNFNDASPTCCVHLDPTDTIEKHTPFVIGSKGQNGPDYQRCSQKPNRLVYQITRQLCILLKDGNLFLDDLYQALNNTINAQASACVVCAKRTGMGMRRAVPCNLECQSIFVLTPPSVQFPEVTLDPVVLDLILHCLYASAKDPTGLELLPGCSIPKNKLIKVINSFTSLDAKNMGWDIYNGDYSAEKQSLMRWICNKFHDIFFITAPEDMKVPSMPGCHQFVMVNGNPKKETEFGSALRSFAGGNSGDGSVLSGGVAFHGTSPQRMFKIIMEGLKVMSGTDYMVRGQASGPGVYLAAEPGRAISYASSTPHTWRNGRFANTRILLGCEVAGWEYTANTMHLTTEEATLMVRYVFVVPYGCKPPISGHVEPAMRSAFASAKVNSRW